MIGWFPAVWVLLGESRVLRNILNLRPSALFELVLLMLLLYGVFLLVRANVRALLRTLFPALPLEVKLVKRQRIIPKNPPSWKKPRLPLFFQFPFQLMNDYYRVDLNIFEVRIKGLPKSFDGFRVAHITDIHYDTRLDKRFYETCIRKTNCLHPDAVIITGDNICRQRYTPEVAGILGHLEAPEGIFVLRGNHDMWQNGEQVRKEMIKQGFAVLDNRSAAINRDGQQIRIVGVEHPWNRARNWDKDLFPKEEGIVICATHTPDNFRRAAKAGAALVLCGHTHGGQVRLPFFGPVVCPSRFSRRYDQGFFKRDQSLMYINRGIGSTVPLRMRCPSEICLFILQPDG